jgi:hypothetical protein
MADKEKMRLDGVFSMLKPLLRNIFCDQKLEGITYRVAIKTVSSICCNLYCAWIQQVDERDGTMSGVFRAGGKIWGVVRDATRLLWRPQPVDTLNESLEGP